MYNILLIYRLLFAYSFSYSSGILWVKGNKRIPIGKKGQRERRRRRRRRLINNHKGSFFSGNAFVTKKGTLQIRRTEIKDGGLYTCMGKCQTK